MSREIKIEPESSLQWPASSAWRGCFTAVASQSERKKIALDAWKAKKKSVLYYIKSNMITASRGNMLDSFWWGWNLWVSRGWMCGQEVQRVHGRAHDKSAFEESVRGGGSLEAHWAKPSLSTFTRPPSHPCSPWTLVNHPHPHLHTDTTHTQTHTHALASVIFTETGAKVL